MLAGGKQFFFIYILFSDNYVQKKVRRVGGGSITSNTIIKKHEQ